MKAINRFIAWIIRIGKSDNDFAAGMREAGEESERFGARVQAWVAEWMRRILP